MRGSVAASVHLISGSSISLFLALFVITTNAEKSASHSHVDKKGIKSQIEVLAALGYKANVSEQYAGKFFS